MTLQPGTPIGKYVVRKLLAQGGMGEVYLCTSFGPAGFEKEVVVKRVRPPLAQDREFVKMFIAEARLASKLNHPNVVQIFDFDRHEDTYYLGMEYVRGRSLREVQQRRKAQMVPFSSLLIAHIGAEVARALHYAHGLTEKGAPLNLVHRDCTPHNVLLSYDGAVKLADFGVAKAANQSTAPGALKGKFAYMSPEQARGDSVDARTDVFALGIVLWEMLSGSRLFEADSDSATLRAVQQSAIVPVARLNPDVPEALSAVVMKALERSVQARYQSARELEWALTEFLRSTARSSQDLDLAGFIRQLFPEDAAAWGQFSPTPSSQSAGRAGQGPTVPASDQPYSPPQAAPLSPDEDPRASTERLRPVSSDPRSNESRASSGSHSVRRPLGRSALIAGGTSFTLIVGAVAAIRVSPQLAERVGMRRGAPSALTEAGPAVPANPSESPAPPAPKSPDGPEESPDEAPAPTPVEPEGGALVLYVSNLAKVYVDGKFKGELVGRHRFTVPAGEHRVRFHTASGKEREQSVQVEARKTTEHFYSPFLP